MTWIAYQRQIIGLVTAALRAWNDMVPGERHQCMALFALSDQAGLAGHRISLTKYKLPMLSCLSMAKKFKGAMIEEKIWSRAKKAADLSGVKMSAWIEAALKEKAAK